MYCIVYILHRRIEDINLSAKKVSLVTSELAIGVIYRRASTVRKGNELITDARRAYVTSIVSALLSLRRFSVSRRCRLRVCARKREERVDITRAERYR